MTAVHGKLLRPALFKLVWYNSSETVRRQTINLMQGLSPEHYAGFLRLNCNFHGASVHAVGYDKIVSCWGKTAGTGEDIPENELEKLLHLTTLWKLSCQQEYSSRSVKLNVSEPNTPLLPWCTEIRYNWIIRSKATKQTQVASSDSKPGVCFIRGCKTTSTMCSL